MREEVLARIQDIFDVPVMQNNLRGLWVELMVLELLGSEWEHSGNDWAAWDLERNDGLRVEVKQSARQQSWGPSSGSPRFSIATAKGHYPDGKTYAPNISGKRLANLYIFAWHDGVDQRSASEWQFYVVQADRLPRSQKSIGRNVLQKLTNPVDATELLREVSRLGR
ncbi:hypothetical protein [Sediminimonas qiaohouensis]|uniref:hypothetical protein n=1 Tax=Sediminimonas qiaohouensis TaxID=552061 RepID=UPI0012EE08B8|nr:hypothetical protein [Sediminimonas qiaohouensis]